MRPPYRFYTTHRIPGGPPVWLALVDEDASVYVWSPDLARFVFHQALTSDLNIEGSVHLAPASPQEAAEICSLGQVGKLDGEMASVLDRLRTQDDTVDPRSVLPALAGANPDSRPQRAARMLLREPNHPIIYDQYPIAKLASARRAASDIKNGRVRGFAALLGDRLRDLRTEVRQSSDGKYALLILSLTDQSLGVAAGEPPQPTPTSFTPGERSVDTLDEYHHAGQ